MEPNSGPGHRRGLGDLGTDGPGPDAAIRGAPKLITGRGNGRSGVNMELRTAMIRLLIVGISIISTAPLYAQRQQQNVGKLKAEARNTVGVIGGDKVKIQTYCQIVDLGRQMNQAVGQKDHKKAKVLVQQIIQLQKQLPEFIVLSNIVKRADPNSSDGQEITAIIRSLNQSCPE